MVEKFVCRSYRTSPTHLTTHADQPRQEITITLLDGSQRKGTSWETSPMDIAKEISKGLADRVVIAKVCTHSTHIKESWCARFSLGGLNVVLEFDFTAPLSHLVESRPSMFCFHPSHAIHAMNDLRPRSTATYGISNAHWRGLAHLNFSNSIIQKVCCIIPSRMILFSMVILRETRILALFGTRSRGGRGTSLWLPPLHRTTNG